MKFPLQRFLLLLPLLSVSAAPTEKSPQSGSVDGVKSYLLKTLTGIDKAAEAFVSDAAAYAKIIDANGGDYAKALAASRGDLRALVAKMQEEYKAMDSFGYEQIEGIVAGVERLKEFDVYLDAGVPAAESSNDSPAAPVVLHLSNGAKIDREGCLFTYIIEPMLWGSQPKYVVPIDVDGDGKIAAKESLPKAEVLTAAAMDVRAKIADLVKTSNEWQPSIEDCFGAIVAMTPTLSGYFDDWKESRYAGETSGKFSAVSRVSDMKGIMQSVSVLYDAVNDRVKGRDPALAKAIKQGFTGILAFIDRVDAREKKAAGKISAAEIDELAAQAKEKSDKLVPQVEQAAAILNIKIAG